MNKRDPYNFDSNKNPLAENLLKSYHTPDLEKAEDNDLEKSKGTIGETREWSGKKYKKQSNGKWKQVSYDHGGKDGVFTKKEHQEAADEAYDRMLRTASGSAAGDEYLTQRDLHEESAENLSDEEHEDDHFKESK